MTTYEQFGDLAAVNRDLSELIRPPKRVTVAESAQSIVRIVTPGGYSGPWDPTLTPYMVEPMNMLKSRDHEAVALVSPARSGKTQGVLDGWLAHIVTADQGDVGFYFSTQTLAHDYRKRRVERLHKYSRELREKLSPRAHDTTIEMVVYRSGMIFNLGWPTSSQLAQRDLRYVALSDYDSFPLDIGGEGSPFALASNRIQVAMSAGMALVESSPKRPIIAAAWQAEGPHEAPPTDGGILPLYNRGDRRMWYWRCLDGCNDYFPVPAFPDFDEREEDPKKAAASARVHCSLCGTVYDHDRKRALNGSGVWRAEEGRTSNIASYWLLGCAAAFRKWSSIVDNYLEAKRVYEQTGDETLLATTITTHQGLPYRPVALGAAKSASYLDDRREHEMQRYHVPDGASILFAAVDVQSDRFEVAVWAYGAGKERWLVDRYSIRKSLQGSPLQPAIYIEHWDVLTEKVLKSTYRIDDDMSLRVHCIAVDSAGMAEKGGSVQVTSRAYDWWRSLRTSGFAPRAYLVKGVGSASGPMIKKSYPDSRQRQSQGKAAVGDVPVLLLRVNPLKDAAHIDLQRDVPGPGYVHIPGWVPGAALKELISEQRNAKGWSKITTRNETWDLLIYADSLWMQLNCDRIQWDKPPAWASSDWDLNPNVVNRAERKALKDVKAGSRIARQPKRDGNFVTSWR